MAQWCAVRGKSWLTPVAGTPDACQVHYRVEVEVRVPALSSFLEQALEKRLLLGLGKNVYNIDGDNLRTGLTRDLGFSAADRAESVRRASEVSQLFSESGVITVVLPPPMIICSQLEPPLLAAATKLRTRVTWLGLG